jgi:hypothetical protein
MEDTAKYLIPDEGIAKFLEFCHQRIGAAYFQTPRETVKAFVGLLRVLEQNPNKKWDDIVTLDSVPTQADSEPKNGEVSDPSSDLAEFKL